MILLDFLNVPLEFCIFLFLFVDYLIFSSLVLLDFFFQITWVDHQYLPLSFEDRRVVDDHRFSIVRPYIHEWNLQINDVRWEDQGQYRCTVNTEPVKSKIVMLHVKGKRVTKSLDREIHLYLNTWLILSHTASCSITISLWVAQYSVIVELNRQNFRKYIFPWYYNNDECNRFKYLTTI